MWGFCEECERNLKSKANVDGKNDENEVMKRVGLKVR